MMPRARVFILIPAVVFLFSSLTGCVSEFNLATNQEETLMYSTAREIKIGDAVARQLEDHYKVDTNPEINERVQRVTARLGAVTDRRDLVYITRVLDDKTINALSLPGGYIYIFKGLYDKLKTDDELAAVIGHEMGHINAKHALKRLQSSYGYTALQVLAIGTRNAQVAQGLGAIYTTLFFAYSKRDEFQADALSVKYMKRAGYNPDGMLKVLQILQKQQEKEPLHQLSYFHTHPFPLEREAAVEEEITGEINFKGYLNTTGDDQ